ncbi:MAG: phosphatidylglycerophosphatase A family protein [Acetobacteraceae bacterium]
MNFSQPSADLARIVASGCGLGLVPRAPGTLAAAVATLIAAGLIVLSPFLVAAAAAVAIAAGLWAIPRAGGSGDPGWVVIDEFVGQWIALLVVPRLEVAPLIAGFVLFRLLDISKPGPIRAAERLPGALGVIADDVVAGAIAALILLAAMRFWYGALG